MKNLLLNSLLLGTFLLSSGQGHSQQTEEKPAQEADSPEPGSDPASEPDSREWDIDSPPWETMTQPINAKEGTWINLDVSPDGRHIVFDFLGDIYLMPLTGADGTEGNFPTRLTHGLAWDMQPTFSPDGQTIAFTSDRTGKSKHAGDNIWIMSRNGDNLRQITDETYRLLNGPCWSPDGQYIVARKHFTSRRSLGAGEMWMYHRSGVDGNAQGGVRLTEKPTEQKDVNEPVFSPDGKYLYYSEDASPGNTFEYDKDSNKQIYVIKRLHLAESETETLISGAGGACRPVPSPDGNTIAFVRRFDGKSALHLFDVASGAVRRIHDNLERDMQEAWAIHGVYPAFEWTPDNQSIVLWARGKIRRIRVSDGRESVIPFHIRDERTVTKALRTPIPVAPETFDVRMLRWVRVSPDGKQAIFQALGYLYVKDLPDGAPQTSHFPNGSLRILPCLFTRRPVRGLYHLERSGTGQRPHQRHPQS